MCLSRRRWLSCVQEGLDEVTLVQDRDDGRFAIEACSHLTVPHVLHLAPERRSTCGGICCARALRVGTGHNTSTAYRSILLSTRRGGILRGLLGTCLRRRALVKACRQGGEYGVRIDYVQAHVSLAHCHLAAPYSFTLDLVLRVAKTWAVRVWTATCCDTHPSTIPNPRAVQFPVPRTTKL